MEDIEPMITTKELRDMAAVNQYIAFTLKKDQHKKLLDTLPTDLRKKLQALRKLQADTVKLDAEFHQEIYNIERIFLEKYSSIFEKRRDIIIGDHCPTDEECTCSIPGLEAAESEAVNTGNIAIDGANAANNTKGIPNFWLNTFKYAPLLDTMVKEADEPVLKYLQDVRVTSKPAPDMSFTLQFYFGPNEYFTDTMLTKEYFMKCTPDPDHPFSFDGPEIYNAIGCAINWQPDKNVTMKLITSGKDATPKSIKIDSFFNFFDTIVVPEDTADEKYDKLTEYLQYDFEIGHYIKEKIVPKAVLYFTGEADDDIDDSEISTVSNDDEVREPIVLENDEGEGDG